METQFDLLDLLAGFAGAVIALFYQPRMPYWRMIVSLAIGSVSGMYGGPALDAMVEMPDELERLYSVAIGLTAQAYLIPGIMEAASALSSLPSKWIKRKWGDDHDQHP